MPRLFLSNVYILTLQPSQSASEHVRYYIYFIDTDTKVETLAHGSPASPQNEKSELSNTAVDADPHPRSQPGPS